MSEPEKITDSNRQQFWQRIGATVYELQKLRCNLCVTIFTAPAPPEVGSYIGIQELGIQICNPPNTKESPLRSARQ